MKLSSSVITPRVGLRLVVVLLMCCTILVHISAMDENMQGQRRGEDQNANRVSADGAETGEKQSVLHRVRRAVKKNATPSLPDIEKRLKAVEERYVTLLQFPCFSVSKQQFIRINLLIDLISFLARSTLIYK